MEPDFTIKDMIVAFLGCSPLGLVCKAAVDSWNEIDGMKQCQVLLKDTVKFSIVLGGLWEVSSTRERMACFKHLIVPISRYVLMYKISEPLGRVGEELAVERK